MINKRTFAYVGANTSPERGGKAKGISVFEIDKQTGAWQFVSHTDDINPGFLVFNADKTALYCSHANYTEVSAYSIDRENGSLKLLNRRCLGGYNGTHLSISRDGRFLLVAVATSASLAVFPILEDHSLGYLCESLSPAGELGPLRMTEQPNSMPHQIIQDPGGNFVFVPDRGEDRVHTLRLDPETGRLEQIAFLRTRAARTPRHMCFLKSMKKAYVLTEFSATVVCCDYDDSNGILSPFQIVPALPESFVGLFNKGAEIAVHPSEKFLYTSNRGHNSIAIFSINPSDGHLTSVGWQNTYGDVPRFFTIDSSGKYLFVANERSNNIVSFKIDTETGKLESTGQIISTPTPTCILISGEVANIDHTDTVLQEVVGDYSVYAYK